jgi:hypothetical protein
MVNGEEYGSPEYAGDDLPILDPATNTITVFHAPVRDPAVARHRACRDRTTSDAIGPLGRPADLGHAGRQPQHDDRSEGRG